MTFSDLNRPTNQLFIDLKLLKDRDVIKSQRLKLVYEYYDKSLSIDLQNLFPLSSEVHPTNLELNSARKMLHIPTINTTYGIKSNKFRCAELWNEKFKKWYCC